jgi:hypothetical protein
MKIEVIQDLQFKPCKSNFLIKLKTKKNLPQYVEYCKINADKEVTSLVINDYCSLDELDQKIISMAKNASNYFYIAINKFYIYSNSDRETGPTQDYDTTLVQYCYSLIKDNFSLINSTICPDDRGQLGNFVHPITTLLCKRHD